MPELKSDIKYLGSPLFISKNRSASFQDLETKVFERLEGWMSKTLSRAGKATLIKAVAQVIPKYAMTTFKLPKSFNTALDSMAHWFFCGLMTQVKVNFLLSNDGILSVNLKAVANSDLGAWRTITELSWQKWLGL